MKTSPAESRKRILLTGATGSIGHAITRELIERTDHELILLVRDPDRVRSDPQARPGIRIVKGNLQRIEGFENNLDGVEVAILAAAVWGGPETHPINVDATLELIERLGRSGCKRILYFSTASILDREHRLLEDANRFGTDYIRSKFQCLRRIEEGRWAERVTSIFPTLVLANEPEGPVSHFSNLLATGSRYMWLIRFFRAEGSFHFIHARDVASVVRHLVDHPEAAGGRRRLVLGNPAIHLNEAVEQCCRRLGKRIYFRIPLFFTLARFFVWMFRIQLTPWDRYCMGLHHFTYRDPVSPAVFDLPVHRLHLAGELGIDDGE